MQGMHDSQDDVLNVIPGGQHLAIKLLHPSAESAVWQ
jgi:hypothetical protein